MRKKQTVAVDGLDYEKLSEEEIKYLQDQYIDMFERQKEINNEKMAFFSKIVDESKMNVNSLD